MSTTPHFWTTAEERVLRDFYPALGPQGVAARLPGRSLGSITTRASQMGVRFEGARPARQKRWAATEAIDAALRRVYERADGETRNVRQLAEDLGYPHWWLKRRAVVLGLSRPVRSANWTPPELDIVRQWHGASLETIQRRLRAAGFERTRTAVHIARRRLRLSCRAADRYTATELAKMLGIRGETVARWCRLGWLEAERRETGRTEVQGGDMFWIAEADVRAFVAANRHLVDLRKVRDAEWFIGLLLGEAGDGRQHQRAKPARLRAVA